MASAISIPVECGEHERLSVTSTLSCENVRVDFMDTHECSTPGEQYIKQERLTGLALLNVHNSTPYIPSTHEIRLEFLKKNHRLIASKPI